VLQQRDDQEILRSQGFPGLQVAVEALLAGDMQRVLTVATELRMAAPTWLESEFTESNDNTLPI
jgi:hypothetical protein